MKIIKIKKADGPRWNRKAYKSYIVLENGKIESGWEFPEDAKDRLQELKEDKIKARIVSAKTLNADPEDKANWHTGGFNGLRKSDADTSEELYRKVASIDETLLNFIMDLNSCFALAKNAHESRTNAATNDVLDDIIERANRIIKKSKDLQKSLDW